MTITTVVFLQQDGSERLIDSLSLIDAVMPDVVASRQQANQQSKAVVKAEIPSTNGDEGKSTIYVYCHKQ